MKYKKGLRNPMFVKGYDRELLEIPLGELAFIFPDARQRLFMDMLSEYSQRVPAFKLKYAALNYKSTLKIEYLIIFETVINDEKIIIYDSPYIYTTRAIPGYRYCKREGKLDEWFHEALHFMCRLPKSRFIEFIESNDLDFRKNPNNPTKHWKDPKNLDIMLEKCAEMHLQYKSTSGGGQ